MDISPLLVAALHKAPSWLIEQRYVFVLMSVALVIFTVACLGWVIASTRHIKGGGKYKAVPYIIGWIGLAMLHGTTYGYFGYEIWRYGINAPSTGDWQDYLVIPINLGGVIWMVGFFVFFRQLGRGYMESLSKAKRVREIDRVD